MEVVQVEVDAVVVVVVRVWWRVFECVCGGAGWHHGQGEGGSGCYRINDGSQHTAHKHGNVFAYKRPG